MAIYLHRIRWRFAGWLVAAVLTLLHAWMLYRLAVNFPLQDDFTQFLTVPRDIDDLPTVGGKIAYLISSSGDHRILTLRLAALIQAKVVGEINFRTLVFWGNLLCATAGVLVLSAARAEFRPWLAALLATLIFSVSNWLPQYWASASLQHYSLLAYAFGAIFCLTRPALSWQAGALFLALCAAMTGANGLMVFPIGAALLYRLGKRRTSFLWFVLAVVIFALYFIDYRVPPGRPPPLQSLQHPIRLVLLALGTLGSVSDRFMAAVAIGSILIVVWTWLIVHFRARPVPLSLLAWMALLLLCAATIAFGRAPFGNDAILNSRYRVYSEMAIFITLTAVLWRVQPRQGNRLLLILSPIAAIWFWQSWTSNLPPLEELITQQTTSLTHWSLTGQGIYRGFPPQDVTDSLLERAYDDGYFRPSNPSGSVATLIESDSLLVQAGNLSLWSDVPIVDARSITMRGFARANEPRIVFWLEGNRRLFHGELQTKRLWNPIGRDWVIFWNTSLLDGVAPGRYRSGYSSGSAWPPVVTWTDNWVEIKAPVR